MMRCASTMIYFCLIWQLISSVMQTAHKLQKLAVEVDGPHHFEGRRGRLQEYVDRRKDNQYWRRGISLLRLAFWGRLVQPEHA